MVSKHIVPLRVAAKPRCWPGAGFRWTIPAMTSAPPTSYVHGASDTPLLGETIGANLRRTVERLGTHPALVVRSQGYRATYRELWDATTAAARGLLALGVKKGDRVGIWSPNRFEWVSCSTRPPAIHRSTPRSVSRTPWKRRLTARRARPRNNGR